MACWKCAIYSCILALALFVHVVSPQAPPNQCQSLLTVTSSPLQCEPVEDCSGLQCPLTVGGGLNNYVASFMTMKCQDPVTVNLTIAGPSDADVQQTALSRPFTRSELVELRGSSESVAVTMTRNASHLTFGAMSRPAGIQLIPQVDVFLNASDCMCFSLYQLAGLAVHSVVEPECNTNADCNGVRCELDFGILLYYVELIILPCDNAVQLVVEDSNFQPLHSTNFTNQTGTQIFTIEGFPLTARTIIEVFDYSMVVQASIDVPFIGEEEIIPRHTILLDRTRCNSPLPSVPPTTVRPPTSISLPNNPSDTCLAFSNIVASAQSEPFICRLMMSCDRGISCRLNLPGRQSYIVNITIEDSQDVVFSVVNRQGEVIVMTTSADAIIALTGTDVDTSLVFTQKVDVASGLLGVRLDLIRDNQLQSLISQTQVPLPSKGKLSQGQIIAIAATVPFFAILLISVVVVIGIWGCVLFVKHRRQTKPFDFKPMSYSDLQAGELESYLKTGASVSGGHTERENGVSPEQEEETKKDLTVEM